MKPENQASDVRLIKSAQEGDTEAFGQLYERYATNVFRFLYAHTGNRLDAEDLTEEVFLRAWRALPAYREQGVPFSAYVVRIAHNGLVDFYRTNRKGAQDTEFDIDEIELHDHRPDPSEMVASGQQSHEIRETLKQLREEYRTVLVARFINEMSPEETAQVMGKSVGAIRVLQHRALAALRKLMAIT